MRQIQPVIKGETDSSTVIVRDVNTPTWKSAIRKKKAKKHKCMEGQKICY